MAKQVEPCYTETVQPKSLRDRIRDIWAIIRGLEPWYGEIPREGRRRRRPPREDELVPIGPPKNPPREGAVALPLPEPEDWDVEAYGWSLPDD